MFVEVIKTFAKENPVAFALNLGMMTVTPISDVYLPHMYGKLIDAIEKGVDPTSVIIIIVIILVVIQFLSFARDMIDTQTMPIFERITRNIIMSKIFEKYESNYSEIHSGEVISYVIATPDIIKGWFSILNDYIIPYSISLFVMIVYLLRFDYVLAIYLIILIIVLVLLFFTLPKKCLGVSKGRQQAYSKMNEEFDEVFRNMPSVYSCEQTKDETRILSDICNEYSTKYLNTMKCVIACKTLATPLVPVFIIAFILRIVFLQKQGRIGTSEFASTFMIGTGILANVTWIISLMRARAFDMGTWQSAMDYFSSDSRIKKHEHEHERELDGSIRMRTFDLVINKTSVGLSHVSFRGVFEDASIVFEKGERTLITGSIGSGKSTLLKLLMSFYVPEKGDMFLDGSLYSDLSLIDIRRKIGYVPQDPILFNRTIIDNIMYGNKTLNLIDVTHFVQSLGVYNDVNALAGKNGSQLSGGQRQLVWCLRVLLRNPEIIIMDEPTASMDDRTKRVLVHLLDTLGKGKTIIMVTHDDFLKRIVTQKVVVSNGKIYKD